MVVRDKTGEQSVVELIVKEKDGFRPPLGHNFRIIHTHTCYVCMSCVQR